MPGPSKSLRDKRVAGVLARAPIAYLAVETAGGPHVTPLLFAASPDRLWFGIGRGTLKARAIRKNPAVGVLIGGIDGSVVVQGQATLLDGPSAGLELGRAPLAIPLFASRNALEMAAFARDTAKSRLQPAALVPVSVRPESVQMFDGWTADAVLGWAGGNRPIALPARWNATTQRARVPAGPLKAGGGPRTAAACVCIDDSDGRGPLAKRGRLLRGTGRARLRGGEAVIALEPARITRWKGFQTETSPIRS